MDDLSLDQLALLVSRQNLTEESQNEIKQALLKHLKPPTLDQTCEIVVVNTMEYDITNVAIQIYSSVEKRAKDEVVINDVVYTANDDDDDDEKLYDDIGLNIIRIDHIKAHSYRKVRDRTPASIDVNLLFLPGYNYNLAISAKTNHSKWSQRITAKQIVPEPRQIFCVKSPFKISYSLVRERLVIVLTGVWRDSFDWKWLKRASVFVDQDLDTVLSSCARYASVVEQH